MNVAILGAGNIAGSMAAALKGLVPEVNMYAVASRSLDKAKAFAEKWGFEKAYGSYEELAGDSAIDLVYVATPHSEHFENAKLCINAGRNCLVEKAFCANMMQARELIQMAEEKHVFICEAMWTRFLPCIKQIRELLNSGKIGVITSLESDFSVPISHVERLKNPALAGGALLDLGIYSLTVPALFLGTDIEKVETQVEKYSTGVDATSVTKLIYKNGACATVKSSFVDDHSNYARITGTEGSLEFGPINNPDHIRIYDAAGSLLEDIPVKVRVNGYEYEVLACKAALEAGKLETEEMPHMETLRMMGWMDSLRNRWGVVYPFEKRLSIMHSDKDIWKKDNIFD